MRILLLFFILGLDFVSVKAQQAIDSDTLRLNQIQTIGSHNSYRIRTEKGILRAIALLSPFYIKKSNPAHKLSYTHLPFPEQFENYGIRSLEIDIHYDPQGGLFYKRHGNFLALKRAASKVQELKEPGMKVLHISDVDYNTHYHTFVQSLIAVKKWSDAHPQHLPIYILVEPKDYGPGNKLKGTSFVEVLPFDKVALEAIDNEIIEVFENDLTHILKPDDIRGNFPTLNQAVTQHQWPRLKEARGKIVFIINGGMESTLQYADGHPSFEGRMMFSFSQEGRPEAAFLKFDNPFAAEIPAMVKKGYMIRSRTDNPGNEAYKNDYTTMNQAILCGAQILSTDYYKPDLNLSTYHVSFQDGKVGKLNFLVPAQMEVIDWKEK